MTNTRNTTLFGKPLSNDVWDDPWYPRGIPGRKPNKDETSIHDLEELYNAIHRPLAEPKISDEILSVLEALEKGISIEEFLKANPKLRTAWNAHKKTRDSQEKKRKQEEQKRKQEAEAKEKVLAKLTPEEIEALGLNKKQTRKAKSIGTPVSLGSLRDWGL